MNENQTSVIRLTANETVTWSITGGADQAKFQIAADGTLTFAAAPNFEAPSDADANNSYVVEITATDSGSIASTLAITVTVRDIDDTAPVKADSLTRPFSIQEALPGVAAAHAGLRPTAVAVRANKARVRLLSLIQRYPQDREAKSANRLIID